MKIMEGYLCTLMLYCLVTLVCNYWKEQEEFLNFVLTFKASGTMHATEIPDGKCLECCCENRMKCSKKGRLLIWGCPLVVLGYIASTEIHWHYLHFKKASHVLWYHIIELLALCCEFRFCYRRILGYFVWKMVL